MPFIFMPSRAKRIFGNQSAATVRERFVAELADQLSSREARNHLHNQDMPLLERITIEPGKCGWRLCIRGTRFRVVDMMELVAAGASHEEIIADYPFLESADIQAALLYLAKLADHTVLAAA